MTIIMKILFLLVLKKRLVVGTSSTCKSSITYETVSPSPTNIASNLCTPKNNRAKEDTSTTCRTTSTNLHKKRSYSPDGMMHIM